MASALDLYRGLGLEYAPDRYLDLSLKGLGGGGEEILRFTSHETNIYVFTLLKNRGRTKCQKRYVSPIL